MSDLSKKLGLNASERDGVAYRTAALPEMICSMGHNGVMMCFMVLTMYASYIGNEGYGIGVVMVGTILTVTKAFDGVTDAISAAIFEKMPATHGKIRILVVLGWSIEALAVLFLFNWAVNKFSGVMGIVMFTFIYVMYQLGYTLCNVTGGTVATVLTNDPNQRPMMGFIDTAFSYGTPLILNNVIAFAILPRYDNQYNAPMLKEACFFYVGVSLILMLMTCYGVRKVDVAATYETLGGGKEEKITFRDMWNVLRGNRNAQMYIFTCASDKLAQSVASQSVVNVMLAGILIGSYKATTMIGNVTSIVGLICAFAGGVYVARTGVKKATFVWSFVSIVLTAIMIVFCIILGKDGMSQIAAMSIPMVVYIAIQIALTGSKMVLSVATSSMRGDIVDYELERSGKYLPAVVNGVYSFISKLISAVSASIAAVCVAVLGYTDTMPQMGDAPTSGIFFMTMFLCFGLPILGWVCNLIAMKFYTLDKARMVEVQKNIARRKKEAAAKAAD